MLTFIFLQENGPKKNCAASKNSSFHMSNRRDSLFAGLDSYRYSNKFRFKQSQLDKPQKTAQAVEKDS